MVKKSSEDVMNRFLSAGSKPPDEAPKRAGTQESTADADLKELAAQRGFKLVKESKSKRLQLLVRPSTVNDLQRLADAKGVSRNELINQIFDEYIEKEK